MSVRVSVVIPTFNRSEDLANLLGDISRQTEKSLEVLVIDDGSDDRHITQYVRLVQNFGERFRFVKKEQGQAGRGPGASRNRGMARAKGQYIAFCDDDDRWLTSDHLELGCQALDSCEADLYWADMQTHQGGVVLNPSMYAEFSMLRAHPVRSLEQMFEVDRRSMCQFLRHRIIHCDSMILRRSLLEISGGYWDHLRFTEDHDFCFRVADRARKAVFRSSPVAALNVSPHESVARSINAIDRLLFGIMALNHAEAVLTDSDLVGTARANRSWKILELAEVLGTSKNKGAARRLVWESFFVNPSVSGLVRCLRTF